MATQAWLSDYRLTGGNATLRTTRSIATDILQLGNSTFAWSLEPYGSFVPGPPTPLKSTTSAAPSSTAPPTTSPATLKVATQTIKNPKSRKPKSVA